MLFDHSVNFLEPVVEHFLNRGAQFCEIEWMVNQMI